VDTVLKNITTYILSVLLVVTIVHIDNHINEHQGGYTICDITCDDERHHMINHQCQKCLNKNQRFYSITEIVSSINQNRIEYFNIKNKFDAISITFDLHSRPPPSLI